MPRATFLCPLCRELGRTVLLIAALESVGRLLVVIDLQGCEHADGFGDLDALTDVEEWRLITAALYASEAPLMMRASRAPLPKGPATVRRPGPGP